jgi:hypothetical protein
MVYEYRLDEVNKVATVVWSYSPTPPVVTGFMGKAQRLPNGNTFVGWGGPSIGDTNHPIPACTEVTPSGRVVFQMNFNDPFVSTYRAFRCPYPSQSRRVTTLQLELMPGNTYNFGPAGVSLTVTAGGGGYNTMFVTREPYAPIDPLFNGKPPRVLPLRVSMTEAQISTLGADIDFDATTFGFANPTNLTVYYRSSTGQGLFVPQETSFNPVGGKLSISMNLQAQGTDFGEFIFAYPDLVQVPYPPILNQVENYRGVQVLNLIAPLAATTGAVYVVNQNLPVLLSWSPRGFAGYYQLQVSANQDFSNPLIDIPYQTDAYYVITNPLPGAAYFYRVKTWNDGGEGNWAAGSFQTAPPSVQVTAPNHGEAWRRGVAYFVQWNDNLAENVKIDLYKGGSFVRSITADTPSTGAFKWSIPFSLTPGNDYTIQITSVTNTALTSASAQPFSIVDAPVISGSQVTRLPNGGLQFAFSAPGAAQATVWGTTILSPPNWQNLGAVPVTNGSGKFTNTPPLHFYRVSVP